jgi:hypothetical protein
MSAPEAKQKAEARSRCDDGNFYGGSFQSFQSFQLSDHPLCADGSEASGTDKMLERLEPEFR